MPKTLPDGRIQVEQGDTLSAIYGSNWKQLSGYTGDPTKLQIGTVLPAIPKSSLGGSLTGEEESKSIPSQPTDHLSMFKEVLKMVTNRAAKESVAKGGESFTEGLRPDQMSGGTFADIMNFALQQKTKGIKDIYQSTIDLLTESRARADQMLAIAINTGAIAGYDNITLEKMGNELGYPLEYMKGLKKAAIEEKTSTDKMTDLDRVGEINKIFSKKLGEDMLISAQDYMEGFKTWLGLNGSIASYQRAYPVDEWMGTWEYKNLPTGWQPDSGAESVKDLPAENQIAIKQIQAIIDLGYDDEGNPYGYDQAVEDFPEWALFLKS